MLMWRDRRLTYDEVDRRIDALRTARQPHHRCRAAAARWHQLTHRRRIRLSRPGHAVPRRPITFKNRLVQKRRAPQPSPSRHGDRARLPRRTHTSTAASLRKGAPGYTKLDFPDPRKMVRRCARLRRLGQRTQRSQRPLQLFPADERCASRATRSQTFTKSAGARAKLTIYQPLAVERLLLLIIIIIIIAAGGRSHHHLDDQSFICRRRLSVSRDRCSSVVWWLLVGPGSDLSEESACGVSAGRAGRQSRPRVSSRACLLFASRRSCR